MNQLDGYRELFRLSIRIPDWRSDLGKLHRLSEVLFIMVVALIAGGAGLRGDLAVRTQEHRLVAAVFDAEARRAQA